MQLQIVPYVEVQKMSLETDQTSSRDTRLWMSFDIEQKSRCRTSRYCISCRVSMNWSSYLSSELISFSFFYRLKGPRIAF